MRLIVFLLTPLFIAWRGYVFTVLWSWFVVPTFGLPALSVPIACGVALTASYCVMRTDLVSAEREPWQDIAIPLLFPLIGLGYGWVVHLFVHGAT